MQKTPRREHRLLKSRCPAGSFVFYRQSALRPGLVGLFFGRSCFVGGSFGLAVHKVDHLLGALFGADAAAGALVVVNAGDKVGHGDGTFGAVLLSQHTANAAGGAFLHHHGALFLVGAFHNGL